MGLLAPQVPGSEKDLGSEGGEEGSPLNRKLSAQQTHLEGGSRSCYAKTFWGPVIVCYLGRSSRRNYIVAKYVEHKFARRSTPEPQKLRTAICSRDLLSVLEAFANGQDFGQLLPGPDGQVRAPPGASEESYFLVFKVG